MQNRPKNKTQCSVFLKYTRITPAFATPITQTNVKISALYRIQAKESDPHFQMSHVFTSIQKTGSPRPENSHSEVPGTGKPVLTYQLYKLSIM